MQNPFVKPPTPTPTPTPTPNTSVAPASTESNFSRPPFANQPSYDPAAGWQRGVEAAVGPSTLPSGDDPFGAPAPRPAGGPRVLDLRGRLLLLEPTRLQEGVPNRLKPGELQDLMTVNVTVLDGGPLDFGGRPEEGRPHDKRTDVPTRFEGLYLAQVALVRQLTEAYHARRSGRGSRLVLGRLDQVPAREAGRRPTWVLTDPTEQDKQLARQWLAANPLDQFRAA